MRKEARPPTVRAKCAPVGSTIQVLDPDVVSIHQSLFAHQEIIGKRMQTGVLAVIKASIYQILSRKNQVRCAQIVRLGWYNQKSEGQASCTECDAGRYGTLQGSSEICKVCDQGTYQDEKSKSECQKCPAGKYNEDEGATTDNLCKDCPRGFNNQKGGSKGCDKIAAVLWKPELPIVRFVNYTTVNVTSKWWPAKFEAASFVSFCAYIETLDTLIDNGKFCVSKSTTTD